MTNLKAIAFLKSFVLLAAIFFSAIFFQTTSAFTLTILPAATIDTNNAVAIPTNAIAPSDVLHFLDGSVLHGNLKSMDEANGVSLEHDGANKLITLKPENLDTLQLKNPQPASTNFKSSCSFRFRNGDEISGNLTALDAQQFSLDTWFGSGFKIPRDAVQSVAFGTRSIIFEGPRGLDGWVQGVAASPWEFRDGAFETKTHSIIGRDFKITGSASIEFELSWSGAFGLIIPIYTETVDRLDYSKSFYSIQIAPGVVAVQRTQASPGGGISISMLQPQVQVPQMTRDSKARFEIRANKADGTIEVLVNGERVNRWKDEAGFVAKGTGITFYSQPSTSPVRISNIRISEWNTTPASNSINTIQTNDVIRLMNRDEVGGSLKSVRDGKATFVTGGKELAIPVERLTEIIFADASTNAVPNDPLQVRASLTGSDKISFHLQSWAGNEVRGRSESFGALALSAANIRLLEFNPLRPRTNAAQSASADSAKVSFRNGDVLSGSLDKIETTEAIFWGRSDAAQPLELKMSGVSGIRFAHAQSESKLSSTSCKFQLVNGDKIQGDFVSIDADRAVLENSPAGSLKIPRAQIAGITTIDSRATNVFSGFTGTNGWIAGKITTVPDYGFWEYRDGAFYATKAASVAREMNLPDEASIQFDLSWQGTLQEAIALYTGYWSPINLGNKDNEPDFGGFYSMRILDYNGTVALTGVKKVGPLKTFTNAPVPSLSQKSSAHFEVRVSKPRRIIALLVDGALAGRWTDDTEFMGTGTGIRFVHQGLGSARWSNLLITEWDGQFEEAPAPASERKQDTVKLRNGDKLTGSFESITDGKITVTANGKKIQVPLNRFKQIDLAAKDSPATEQPANVRASLANRQSLTLRLESWNKQEAVATHPILGKVKLNPAVFEEIQFLELSRTNGSIMKEK